MTVVLLGACATPTPTPTPTAAPVATQAPTMIAIPTPSASLAESVKIGDWSADCDGVATDDCEGVAALFVNNLARSWHWVFDQSGGTLSVEPRPQCPTLPDWADGGYCWQVTASVRSGSICMVVARQTRTLPLGFGQVGGDEMTGRAGGPAKGEPTCT